MHVYLEKASIPSHRIHNNCSGVHQASVKKDATLAPIQPSHFYSVQLRVSPEDVATQMIYSYPLRASQVCKTTEKKSSLDIIFCTNIQHWPHKHSQLLTEFSFSFLAVVQQKPLHISWKRNMNFAL